MEQEQTFEITAPDGRKLQITGSRMPNEAELHDIFSKVGGGQPWQPGLEARARYGPHEITDSPDEPPNPSLLSSINRYAHGMGMANFQAASQPRSFGDIGSLLLAGKIKNVPELRGPVGRGMGAIGTALEDVGQSDAAKHLGTAGAMTEIWKGNIPSAIAAATGPRLVTGAGRALQWAGGKVAGAPRVPVSVIERYAPNTGGLPPATGPRLTTAATAAADVAPELERDVATAAGRPATGPPTGPPGSPAHQAYLRDVIDNPRPKQPWTPEAAKARLDAADAEKWHSGSESGGPYAARDAAGHKMEAELEHWYRYHLENPTSAIALASSPAAIRALLMERMNGGQQVGQ